jgi:hypothetical protein
MNDHARKNAPIAGAPCIADDGSRRHVAVHAPMR